MPLLSLSFARSPPGPCLTGAATLCQGQTSSARASPRRLTPSGGSAGRCHPLGPRAHRGDEWAGLWGVVPISIRLCSCPVVAAAKGHRCHGPKQYRRAPVWSWRPDAHNRPCWANVSLSAGLCPLQASGVNFPASSRCWGTHIPHCPTFFQQCGLSPGLTATSACLFSPPFPFLWAL